MRAIGSDLHMDYTTVGQTTHLAARMEQIADPGAIVITPDTLVLAEGYVKVKSLGPIPVKDLAALSRLCSDGARLRAAGRLLVRRRVPAVGDGRKDAVLELVLFPLFIMTGLLQSACHRLAGLGSYCGYCGVRRSPAAQ